MVGISTLHELRRPKLFLVGLQRQVDHLKSYYSDTFVPAAALTNQGCQCRSSLQKQRLFLDKRLKTLT